MYNYPHYKEHDKQKLVEFMQHNPFITLIGSDKNGRIAVTQIPVLLEEREDKIFLHGHIARKSDHHKAFEENAEVLALFTSPHTYISGSWYSSNPRQASTWNYISIHARGKLEFLNEERLTDHLKKLSLHFENHNITSTTVYDNLPAAYLEKLKKAVIAFEIEVTELENVFKLSQNRDEKSYDNIITELQKRDNDAQVIAALMEERKEKVFNKD